MIMYVAPNVICMEKYKSNTCVLMYAKKCTIFILGWIMSLILKSDLNYIFGDFDFLTFKSLSKIVIDFDFFKSGFNDFWPTVTILKSHHCTD